MRILFAVHTYYPDKNGVQMVTEYIAEGVAKQHDVEMLVGVSAVKISDAQSYPEYEEHNGVKIHRIHAELADNHVFIGDKDQYLQQVHREDIDVLVVVCTQSWPFDWIIPELDSIKCGKVLYSHGFSAYREQYPFMQDVLGLHLNAFRDHLYWNKYYKECYKYLNKFDLVTYLSKSSSSYQYSLKHNLKNGVLLGNAVEDEMFDNCSLEHINDSAEALKYIYVANYDANKNHMMLLHAFYEAAKDTDTLTMIGGMGNDFYDALVEENNKLSNNGVDGRVKILFGLDRQGIRDAMEHSDVFVCTSLHEEFPLMLCEAAAKGLGIVSNNVGNASEFDGIVTFNNFNELCSAMRSYTHEHRIISGMKLREYAEKNFKIEDKVKMFLEYIEKVVTK